MDIREMTPDNINKMKTKHARRSEDKKQVKNQEKYTIIVLTT